MSHLYGEEQPNHRAAGSKVSTKGRAGAACSATYKPVEVSLQTSSTLSPTLLDLGLQDQFRCSRTTSSWISHSLDASPCIEIFRPTLSLSTYTQLRNSAMSPFFSSKRPDIDRQKQACIATKAMTNAPALIPTQATAEKLVRTGEPGVAVIEYDDLGERPPSCAVVFFIWHRAALTLARSRRVQVRPRRDRPAVYHRPEPRGRRVCHGGGRILPKGVSIEQRSMP